MNRKQIHHLAKELDEYYNSFPDWYWKFSLHDAEVLKITESELPTDFQKIHPLYNCIKFDLDCTGVLLERNICKILLYNYKIKSNETISTDERIFWLGDTLTQLPNGRYMSDIHLVTSKGKNMKLIITYEKAEVTRNNN